MKRYTEILITTVIIVFLLTMTSCGHNSEPAGTVTETILTKTETQASETVSYNAPEVKNFNGYEYIFLNMAGITNSYGRTMVPESEDGEIVNDSLVKRNRTVEETYNVKITETLVNDVATTLKTSVLAGDNICDSVFVNSMSAYTLAANKMLKDLAEVDAINFDEPWWDKHIVEGYALNGHIYLVNGDISTSDDYGTFVIMFNKSLYKDFGYENPYEMVTIGNWTLDKMNSMIKGVSKDLNGDGIFDENDQYGFLSEDAALYYFYIGSGRQIIERDKATGKYVYTLGDDKAVKIIEDIFNLVYNADTLWDYSNIKFDDSYKSVYSKVFEMFGDKQILFNGRIIGDVYSFNMRDIDSDYGFLPIPKYSEENEYRSFVSMLSAMLCMPITVPDFDTAGLLTDTIAYQSILDVSDAYYESLLNEKAARSEEDKVMLKLILDNKAVDIDGAGTTVIGSGVWSMFSKMLKSGNFTLASSWAAIQEKAQTKLDNFLEKFE